VSAAPLALSTCAEQILGLAPGDLAQIAPGPPLARLSEALARRNLGLVRVGDAETFAWPGHWIGVVEQAGSRDRPLDHDDSGVVAHLLPSPR
jgi:hypothetical protein